MAKAIPNPEPPWSGGGSARDNRPGGSPGGSAAWDNEDLLPKDAVDLGGRLSKGMPEGGETGLTSAQLQAENGELRSLIADLQQELEAASGKSENNWAERQKEYESLLDEKTELIRQLHIKLQDMEEQLREFEQKAAKPPTPKEEELMAMSEELERERCQLQQERRQLDDEVRQNREETEGMNKEMRQMEMQMARERADLARQRMEVQRISDEIRHELERLERDGGLSKRLEQLRQRHHDVMKGRGA